MIRSAGILMPVSSLPSPYGIGTFGKAAYDFADFLKESGQTCWQMLPLGPTSYGDSPYQSFSSYAGNPYFIDLDLLMKENLLQKTEVDSYDWGTNPRYVDYGKLYENRFKVLRLAFERGWDGYQPELEIFMQENRSWLFPYAEYMAIKEYFDMRSWTDWPDESIRTRSAIGFECALNRYRLLLDKDIRFYIFIQFLFYRQWNQLRNYIHSLGLTIMGDLPIYVAMDSADVWAEPEFFQIDETGQPTDVSGVPPDYFSEDGQLWGNPLYRWDKMKEDGFGWWIRRIDGARRLYDIIRIDHFRGFDTYWAVSSSSKTAKEGEWRKGPGISLVGVLNDWFPSVEFVAEDLGCPTPSVAELLRESKWPGMKVLEFAFDSGDTSCYLPHTYPENCICYTGTHDNSPVMLWKDEIPLEDLNYACEYFGIHDPEGLVWGMIRGGMSSVAKLFVAQMQDYLELGKYHRMNAPGTRRDNWQWRMLSSDITETLIQRLKHVTRLYGRINE